MSAFHAFQGQVYVIPNGSFEYTILLNPNEPSVTFRNASAMNTLILDTDITSTSANLIVRDSDSTGIILHGDPVASSSILTVPDITLIPFIQSSSGGLLVYDSSGDVGPVPFGDPGTLVGVNDAGLITSFSAGAGITIDAAAGTISATGASPDPTFDTVTAGNYNINTSTTTASDNGNIVQTYAVSAPNALAGEVVFAYILDTDTAYAIEVTAVQSGIGSTNQIFYAENSGGVVTISAGTEITANGGVGYTAGAGVNDVFIQTTNAGNYSFYIRIVRA